MSCDLCKYCGELAFKTDGNADYICHSRAETGKCGQVLNYDKFQPAGFKERKPGNIICPGCERKSKHCKCKRKNERGAKTKN